MVAITDELNLVFPQYIKDETGATYQLYLEYRTNRENMFVWLITYLNMNKIYYRDEQVSIKVLYNNFIKNIKNYE